MPLNAHESPIAWLRRMARASESCGEYVFDDLTMEETINVLAAWSDCDWDFYPDQWGRKQLEAAKRDAIVPNFNDHEKPIASTTKADWRAWRVREG